MEEVVSSDEALDIIRRLTGAFQFVDNILSTEAAKQQIYVVSGTCEGGLPNLTPLDNMEELCEEVAILRARQLAHPEVRLWMHIFRGRRLPISKGRQWQIIDGDQMIPVTGVTLPDVVDNSGSLAERIDLDNVLANNTPVEPQEAPNAVCVSQPVLGRRVIVDEDDEDSAPQGRDPEIM